MARALDRTLPALLARCEEELLARVVPFWERYALDDVHGGVLNCISDDGAVRSETKYVWSQARALFTFSALYNSIRREPRWLAIATRTAAFLTAHAAAPGGRWNFRTARDGALEEGPGSVYVDAFAIYGLVEYARAVGPESEAGVAAAAAAMRTFRATSPLLDDQARISAFPHAIPDGCQFHGLPMWFALVYHELGELTGDAAVRARALELADLVLEQHVHAGVLHEYVRVGGGLDAESDAGATVVPGHVLESMWFLERVYAAAGDGARARRCLELLPRHLELGWDDEHGGLLLAVHLRGGAAAFHQPDAKLWWPHTEGIYACLRAQAALGAGAAWPSEWLWRLVEYTLATFPSGPDGAGEWVHNCDRRGAPIAHDVVKGLPQVKDPFHLPRALIYCIVELRRQLAEGGVGVFP